MHFVSQSALDIRRKLQKLDASPQTGRTELTILAFKVFNKRDEEQAQKERGKEEAKAKSHHQAHQLLAWTLKDPRWPPNRKCKGKGKPPRGFALNLASQGPGQGATHSLGLHQGLVLSVN